MLSRKKKYVYPDGGPLIVNTTGPRATTPTNTLDGMVRGRMAAAAALGNPSAQRMVSPNPKTGMTPEGEGTHYMSSVDNFARPLLQDRGGNNLEYIENPGPSSEDIRFNTPEEAEYFAENYKNFAPMMNNFEQGGQLTQFDEGGKHQDNPLKGIPQGTAPDGQPNLVEEGETKLNAQDYIFSDRITVSQDIVDAFNLDKKFIGKTFAEVSEKLGKTNSRRENDEIEEKQKERSLNALMEAQEMQKQDDLRKDLEMMKEKHPEFMQQLEGQMQQQPSEEELMQQQAMQQQGQPSEEEMMAMQQQQMAVEQGQGQPMEGGVPPEQMMADGGYMDVDDTSYADGGVLQGIGKGLSMAAPLLNFIPGVGPIASAAAGAAGGAAGMAGNAMAAKAAEQEAAQLAAQQAQQAGYVPQQTNTNFAGNLPLFKKGGKLYPNGGPLRSTPNSKYSSLANIDSYDYFTPLPPRKTSYVQGIADQNITPQFANPNQALIPQSPPLTDARSLTDYANTTEPVTSAPYKPTSTSPDLSVKSQFEGQSYIPEFAPIDNEEDLAVYESTKNPYLDATDKFTPKGEASEDYAINETPLGFAAKLLPAGYNIGRGLFGKVDKLNANDYFTPVNAVKMNIDPQLRETQENFAAGQAGLRGAAVSGGSYLSNLQNMNKTRNQAVNSLYTQKANADAQNQQQVDMFNTEKTGAVKMFVDDYNRQAQARKEALLQEGLSNIKGIADANDQNKLGAMFNTLMAPDFKDKAVYNPFLGKYVPKSQKK